MRGLDRQVFRFALVVTLGGGLAGLATQPARPKLAVQEKAEPIILAVALESAPPVVEEGARVDQCSLNPRDYADDRPIGDKTAHGAKKKKIVACG